MKRRMVRIAVNRAAIVVSKTGNAPEDFELQEQLGAAVENNQMLVKATRDNCQAYYKGEQISLPSTYTQRPLVRTITEQEFMWPDPDTAEIVIRFLLPYHDNPRLLCSSM